MQLLALSYRERQQVILPPFGQHFKERMALHPSIDGWCQNEALFRISGQSSRAAFGSRPLNRLWLSAAGEPLGVPRDAMERSADAGQVQASKCACDEVGLPA
ncbi:MAG: hypothetical protein DMG32_25900 [Acidobacteria bacterium]|nr:MAG: hypothetical protein DMG32_25900 [Acidobacteriota bacterium]